MRQALVVISDRLYLPAACCVHLSCHEDGQLSGECDQFLIVDSAPAEEISMVRDFFEEREIRVEVIPTDIGRTTKYRVTDHFTQSAYTKLYLDQFFDGTWDRLLYLDADVRVLAPLRPLLNSDLKGKTLGAVHDFWPLYQQNLLKDARHRLAMAHESPYFNSGLLLLDWKKVINTNVLGSARQFATEEKDRCIYFDQDALNKVFEGDWTPLDFRWNFHPKWLTPSRELFVAHFIGPDKPWGRWKWPNRYLWDLYRGWYFENLRGTGWEFFIKGGDARVQTSRLNGQKRSVSMSDARIRLQRSWHVYKGLRGIFRRQLQRRQWARAIHFADRLFEAH